METYSPNPQTNANGLVTVEIGSGTASVGSLATINWASGPYYLKTETDPSGGTNYTITGTSQLLSVPYALYAGSAENAFSGSYNDLTNKPVLFDGTWSGLTGKPTFATVATSGSYNDLLNKPALFDGTWTSLTGKPAGFADGIDNIDDADNSITNEIQALSLIGTQLSLSLGGGTVTLPTSGGGDNWGTQSVVTDATLAGNGTTAIPLRIADNGVTSAKIADEAVGTADLANNSVTSAKIFDGTIVTADLADNAITNLKIINAAVSTDKLGNAAVTSPKIASMGATTGQVLTYDGTSWTPQSIPAGTTTWQLSGSDIYFNTGKVGIGKIPGTDLRQFQVLTANNQAIAAVNNSTGYAAIYAQNLGIGPAAEFRNFIKIADGTEGDGKILTSNAIGSASWKTLSVVTDATLTGSGTTASPLRIAQMGATTGQLLKWTGTTWDNADDNTGPWMESDLYIYNSSTKKIGIGNSSPTRKVTITEPGTEAYLNIQNSSTGYTMSDGILIGMQGVNGWLTTYEDGVLNIGTNGTMKMIIEAGGDVGIGTTNPGYRLQVGNYSDGTQARANAWNVFSDVNLKRDLTLLTNPLAMVEKLNGYYFFWNSGTDQSRQIGFSAQEVNEVLPEVVSKGEDGYFSVEYGKITPLLAEAIKQLKAENDRLSLENDQLKTEHVLLQTLYNNLVETDQKTINRLEKLEKILMKSIE